VTVIAPESSTILFPVDHTVRRIRLRRFANSCRCFTAMYVSAPVFLAPLLPRSATHGPAGLYTASLIRHCVSSMSLLARPAFASRSCVPFHCWLNRYPSRISPPHSRYQFRLSLSYFCCSTPIKSLCCRQCRGGEKILDWRSDRGCSSPEVRCGRLIQKYNAK